MITQCNYVFNKKLSQNAESLCQKNKLFVLISCITSCIISYMACMTKVASFIDIGLLGVIVLFMAKL